MVEKDELEIVRTKKPTIRKVIEILVMATVGIAMIVSGEVVASRFEPNGISLIGSVIRIGFSSVALFLWFNYRRLATMVIKPPGEEMLDDEKKVETPDRILNICSGCGLILIDEMLELETCPNCNTQLNDETIERMDVDEYTRESSRWN